MDTFSAYPVMKKILHSVRSRVILFLNAIIPAAEHVANVSRDVCTSSVLMNANASSFVDMNVKINATTVLPVLIFVKTDVFTADAGADVESSAYHA